MVEFIESRVAVTRGWRPGIGSWCLTGAEFPFGEMKKFRDDAVVVQPCEVLLAFSVFR